MSLNLPLIISYERQLLSQINIDIDFENSNENDNAILFTTYWQNFIKFDNSKL